jgi:hypothetical protein
MPSARSSVVLRGGVRVVELLSYSRSSLIRRRRRPIRSICRRRPLRSIRRRLPLRSIRRHRPLRWSHRRCCRKMQGKRREGGRPFRSPHSGYNPRAYSSVSKNRSNRRVSCKTGWSKKPSWFNRTRFKCGQVSEPRGPNTGATTWISAQYRPGREQPNKAGVKFP